MLEIRPLRLEDAPACDDIILGLPYHFALESGRRECASAVRTEAGLVAMEAGEIVGFLTFTDRFDEATEITWLAVRNDRRRGGVGSRLVDHLAGTLRQRGRRFLIVLTISPSEPGEEPADGYGATRAFYRKNGFALARDLPGLWDEIVVLLVRPVG